MVTESSSDASLSSADESAPTDDVRGAKSQEQEVNPSFTTVHKKTKASRRGPGASRRVHCEPLSSETPRDQLEHRLRRIETQLSATQEMIRTLTDLVQDMRQTPQAPPVPDIPLTTSALGTADPTSARRNEVSPRIVPTKPRRHSVEIFGSMTRTIKTQEISMAHKLARDMMWPWSPAAAVKAFRRLRASTLGFCIPERLRRWYRNVYNAGGNDEEDGPRLEDMPPHRLTIPHESSGRAVWDAFVMAMITIDIVLTPLSLSFNCLKRVLAVFNTAESITFSMDFVVHALSSYTTKRGAVRTGPSNTIPHYLFSIWAVADLLAWFPFEYFARNGQFFGVAKAIRLVKISELLRRFHSSRKAGLFRIIGLLSIVLIVSHWLACFWNGVAVVWRENDVGYLDKPTIEQYIHCWNVVINALNASPPAMHTPVEEIAVAVFILIGNVLQASVFGSVAALIQSFDEEEAAYNRKLINTYERCRLLDIPQPLVDRISSFYEHLYRETRSVDPDADAFIEELSPALICEVKFQLYRDMVRQIPFFSSSKIDPVLIEMLILRFRTVIYMQDDMLVRKGEFGDWMGFIGSKGSVGMLDANSKSYKIARVLRKGDYFGEMGLLSRTKRTATAVALSWVQVHVLTRSDLDEMRDQYPEDVELLEQEIRKYMGSRVYWIREGQK